MRFWELGIPRASGEGHNATVVEENVDSGDLGLIADCSGLCIVPGDWEVLEEKWKR